MQHYSWSQTQCDPINKNAAMVILAPCWKIDGVYSFETGPNDLCRTKLNHQASIYGAYKGNTLRRSLIPQPVDV